MEKNYGYRVAIKHIDNTKELDNFYKDLLTAKARQKSVEAWYSQFGSKTLIIPESIAEHWKGN